MKKLLFVSLALLIAVPAKTSFSASFNYAALWSENRYYESTNTSQYGMLADTGVSTGEYDVYMYIPSWTGHEYQKLTTYYNLGAYGAGKFFTTADGYPPPGGTYESRDVYFFIDENGSGSIDSSEPSVYRYYQSDLFSQLPFVTNVKTYYSDSDVMVSWDGIPLAGDFGDDANDQYRVRIIDKAMGDIVFDSGKIPINSSNKYVYNLGELSAYGDNFWIAVEAREGIESLGIGLANRSRYYAELNSNSFVTLKSADLWSEHRYEADGGIYSYFMLSDATTDNNSYNVYIQNIPNAPSDLLMTYLPGWSGGGTYDYGDALTSPTPGSIWEKTYAIYVDKDNSGNKTAGDPERSFQINSGTISKMDLVTNVKISGGIHPTISWEGVSRADQYRVRLHPVVNDRPSTAAAYFDYNPSSSGSGSFSYTYNGDLFSQYDTLAFGIEAREYINGRLINRSRYLVKHSAKQNIKAMPSIPLLLLDQ